MHHRRRTLAVVLTSAAAATFGLHRYIYRQHSAAAVDEHTSENSLKLLEARLGITDEVLKNKGDLPYITVEPVDPITSARYHAALHYLKQAHSTNIHLRERGLVHLARLSHLPSTYISIIGERLDHHSAIKLARTAEANIDLFPQGLPYMFPIRNKKTVTTGNVNQVDDDEMLYAIREFLKKLHDEKKRPLDLLSKHYLKLVCRYFSFCHSQFLTLSSSIPIWMKSILKPSLIWANTLSQNMPICQRKRSSGIDRIWNFIRRFSMHYVAMPIVIRLK